MTALAVLLVLPLIVVLWRLDPFRLQRRFATLGIALCFAALAGLSYAVPVDRENEFHRNNYVSKFARSAAVALVGSPSTPTSLTAAIPPLRIEGNRSESGAPLPARHRSVRT